MLIFKKNIKPLYFVHIPRTGGRHIREMFIKNNFQVSLSSFNHFYFYKEVPHLHYPYYNKFTNYGKIPQFTIVRNPINRFISMFFSSVVKDNLNIEFKKILIDKNLLFNFINEQILNINFSTNWFRPQIHFLNSNCKYWKYENGFGINFCKWLKKNYFFDIKPKKNLYEKLNYDFYKKIKLTKKTKKLIKEYYEFDYKLLNYK